jgi:hypothetical protein
MRAIDPTAAQTFATINHAPLALESRNADAAAEKQAAEADAKLREKLPAAATLDTYEFYRRVDTIGAAIFRRSHAAVIQAETDERRELVAKLTPEPPEAA